LSYLHFTAAKIGHKIQPEGDEGSRLKSLAETGKKGVQISIFLPSLITAFAEE
jgi:hypothetical protein